MNQHDKITLYQVQLFLYNYIGWFVKISFILYMTGILTTKPPYVDEINFILKLFVSMFLIYRFSRFRTYRITLTELDRKVASSAGLYIFVLSFADILRKNIFFKDIVLGIHKIKHIFKDKWEENWIQPTLS